MCFSGEGWDCPAEYLPLMKSLGFGLLATGMVWCVSVQAEVTDMTKKFKVAESFKLEKIYDVKKDEGSWVGLTEDDKGRLIATDQYGGLYRITVPPLAGGETKVEALDIPVAGGHGVLWFEGKLYIVVNEKAEKNSSETGGWVVDAKGEGWGNQSY